MLSENLIELKNINTDDSIGTLAISESSYPFADDQVERMYGMGIKIERIRDSEDASRHLGFEVTVLDLPVMTSLSHQTD